MVRILFNMRSFSSVFGTNPRCSMNCNDLEAIDNQYHILQCQVLFENLNPEEKISASEVKYDDIFGSLEGAEQGGPGACQDAGHQGGGTGKAVPTSGQHHWTSYR